MSPEMEKKSKLNMREYSQREKGQLLFTIGHWNTIFWYIFLHIMVQLFFQYSCQFLANIFLPSVFAMGIALFCDIWYSSDLYAFLSTKEFSTEVELSCVSSFSLIISCSPGRLWCFFFLFILFSFLYRQRHFFICTSGSDWHTGKCTQRGRTRSVCFTRPEGARLKNVVSGSLYIRREYREKI